MAGNLFEFLYEQGLSQENVGSQLNRWNASKLIDFMTQCRYHLPYGEKTSSSMFDFIANSQLSGLDYPCQKYVCRLNNLERLARFSALYADTVLIRDPFEVHKNQKDELEPYALQLLRDDVIISLELIYYLRPLIDNGVVGFARSNFHLCRDCFLEGIGLDNEEYQHKISQAKAHLKVKYANEAKFTLKTNQKSRTLQLHVEAPEYLINHSSLWVSSPKIQSMFQKPNFMHKPYQLSKGELLASKVLDHLINPLVSDIFVQNYYANVYHTQYISDREIEIEVMNVINEEEITDINNKMMQTLSHSLPYIDDVDISKLVNLRKEEGESFRVYRDAIKQALDEIDKSSTKSMRQAFEDVVRPEINNIELTIKNSRKLLWDSLRKDVVFGAGFITMGLFSGLLPQNVGEIVAAVGGFTHLSDVLDKANKLTVEPDEIRNNKYYFLWKTSKKARSRNKI